MPRKVARRPDPFVLPFLFSMLLWLSTLITSFLILYYSTLSKDVVYDLKINIPLKIYLLVGIFYCPLYLISVIIIVFCPKHLRTRYLQYFTYCALIFSIYLMRNIRYFSTKVDIYKMADKVTSDQTNIDKEYLIDSLTFAYKNLDSCAKAVIFIHILFSIPFNICVIKNTFFKPKIVDDRRSKIKSI